MFVILMKIEHDPQILILILMTRSGLETTKLELLSEVSGLKLRQVLRGKN